MKKVFSVALFCVLFLMSCSSTVNFTVLDKKTRDEIEDYTVIIKGKDLEPGEEITLSTGGWPHYKADIKADGYESRTYTLENRFFAERLIICLFVWPECFFAYGPKEDQVVYMSKGEKFVGKIDKGTEKTEVEEDEKLEEEDKESGEESLPPKKTKKKQKKAKVEETEKPIRFGIRGNIGMAETNPNEIVTTSTVWGIETNKSSETIEGGYTYGLGAYALIPIWGIYFVPEITIQHREPVKDFYGLTVAETAIDVPLLFRFRYREENLIYLGIGPYFGVVLDLQDSHDGTFKNHRSKSDIGFTCELGFRINEHFSIDIRPLYSFSSFGIGEYLEIGGDTPTLFQSQIGLNYTF